MHNIHLIVEVLFIVAFTFIKESRDLQKWVIKKAVSMYKLGSLEKQTNNNILT